MDEGYAAVTTRRIASIVELTPPLIHYYFPTTDDLLLAVYRRAAERNRDRLAQALSAKNPLLGLWRMSVDSTPTVLAAEFMALANHRKAISSEIADNITHSRKLHAEAFAGSKGAEEWSLGECSPNGLSFILVAVARALVMERAIGISSGHSEAAALIESWLGKLDGEKALASSKKKPIARKRMARK